VLDEVDLHCPCCGEPITVLVDVSEPTQAYIEDCCRPMVLTTCLDGGTVSVTVRHEDA
jgi:hypothetical protein